MKTFLLTISFIFFSSIPRAFAEVTVIAPEHNWSAAGHSKTMHKPLRAWTTGLADGSEAMAISGSPSDCVAMALLGLLNRTPDLVISGVNLGANIGHDLTYSGTVIEAIAIQTYPRGTSHLLDQANRLKENPERAMQRVYVLRALARVADPASVPALLRLTDEPDPRHRREVARALAAMSLGRIDEETTANIGVIEPLSVSYLTWPLAPDPPSPRTREPFDL